MSTPCLHSASVATIVPSTLISTSVRMVHLQRTSDEKWPGQGRQRINPKEFATTGPRTRETAANYLLHRGLRQDGSGDQRGVSRSTWLAVPLRLRASMFNRSVEITRVVVMATVWKSTGGAGPPCPTGLANVMSGNSTVSVVATSMVRRGTVIRVPATVFAC